ncbi:hypothetical protein HMPREF0201_01756 [Cedecea davisae DSM 4568]|uniref:Uncharacterized protein n=1 Tax=Cedecea davisae DSM 4568 TaxID=566551 RepID=S3IZ50_9ENTR|nr:hypothetical protein HMPREF0201_01756 [Cedecea davisae DSM 4568]
MDEKRIKDVLFTENGQPMFTWTDPIFAVKGITIQFKVFFNSLMISE